MAEFEQKYVFALIKEKSILFLRYMDDIFMVWTKSEKQLKDFISELNQKHSSKSLTTNLTASKQSSQTLQSIQINKINYKLLFSENQVTVKTVLMRNRNICSAFQEYHSHSRKRIEQLVHKGYKRDVVKQQFRKLTNSIKNNCINKNAMINNASLYQ